MATPRKPVKLGLGLAVIGSELMTFAILGVALDYMFGSTPWLTIVMTLLGMVSAAVLTTFLLAAESASRKSSPKPADDDAL